MKKIAKLSLVAAVAVTGFSTANAQPLEEAIKNVEVSGSVVYRYNDSVTNTRNNPALADSRDSATNNNYKVALNLSSKVNEDVKFNSRFIAGGVDNGLASLSTKSTVDAFGNTTGGTDGNLNVELSHAYFGYTGIANTTVNIGKQGLTTPWTMAVDIDGQEETGTGVLALSTLGPVTLAAAYFNQTNIDRVRVQGELAGLDGSRDITTFGAIANLGPVTLDAWYLDLDRTFDSYTIGANSKIDLSGVELEADARYTSLTLDRADAEFDDNSLAKISLGAKAGIVNAKVTYAKTDKEGGLVALNKDAETTIDAWDIELNGLADADFWQGVIGVDVLSNLNLSANYVHVKYDDGLRNNNLAVIKTTAEEIYAQATYKMSKNLSTYVRLGTQENKNVFQAGDKEETDFKGRLQVAYTF